MDVIEIPVEKTEEAKYKFKELKVYNSVEWLYNNRKKYRQVFDRWETDYIYAELSLYNKYFDKDSWDADIMFLCFDSNNLTKPLASLKFRKRISKYDQVVYIREGWGNKKEGAFWKKGTYFWQVYVEGEQIGTKYFYVEESDENSVVSSSYLDIVGLKFYEGHYDEMSESDKKFYTEFDHSQTRYIFCDIALKNNLPDKDWQCELFLKYYTESGELKGETTRLQKVAKGSATFNVISGYGANTSGSWHIGKYRVEVSFLNKIIAISSFDVRNLFVGGIPEVIIPDSNRILERKLLEEKEESFEFLMANLNEMIGLDQIKNQLNDHFKYIQFLRIRQSKGINEDLSLNLHTVFLGNPGTGKTTVAHLLGKIYKSMGLLSKGHVHTVDRSDLVGEFIGQTAPKVKEAIKKAKGGILFVDEAYALARSSDDSKDFGREVIEILVKEMSEGKGDMIVVAAGYPKEMTTFLESNPGLKSRFKINFEFADYYPQELMQIAKVACLKYKVTLSLKAEKLLYDQIIKAFRSRDKSFGNARFVNDLVEKAKINLGIRLMAEPNPAKLSKKVLTTLLPQDISGLISKVNLKYPDIPVDDEYLKEALDELNSLVGMEEIKTQIAETVKLVKYYKSKNKNVLESFLLHTILIGNPGTGKTTVARIISKIYKALGIIERGHLIETDRSGLVAGYVGQTALKTNELVDKALGGVLFIDEAYALGNLGTNQGDFGNEAIQTLLKRMEDDRGKFFVFVAGYPDNMAHFLKINPGLSSRFDKILKFDDYNEKQLYQIAQHIFKNGKYKLSKKAHEKLVEFCNVLHNSKDKYFGNARTIMKFTEEVIKNQNLRIAENLTINSKHEQVIEEIDIIGTNSWSADTIQHSKSIGFKQ
jgi:SpoVK/Ycf46/Vps4 family AAA+-type ATPase